MYGEERIMINMKIETVDSVGFYKVSSKTFGGTISDVIGITEVGINSSVLFKAWDEPFTYSNEIWSDIHSQSLLTRGINAYILWTRSDVVKK